MFLAAGILRRGIRVAAGVELDTAISIYFGHTQKYVLLFTLRYVVIVVNFALTI